MSIEPMTSAHVEAVQRFFASLSDGDITFVKEDVHDPQTVGRWAEQDRAGRRWVARTDEGALAGFVALLPLVGWSSHVGEIRLVVAPAHRGRGLGGELVRHALRSAAELGMRKVVVEVVALQQPVVDLFTRLGFQGEALLRDHIRDRNGRFQDVILLAHFADDQWSAMQTVGVTDEVSV